MMALVGMWFANGAWCIIAAVNRPYTMVAAVFNLGVVGLTQRAHALRSDLWWAPTGRMALWGRQHALDYAFMSFNCRSFIANQHGFHWS